MVEGTGLENRRTGNGIESSNLSLSVGKPDALAVLARRRFQGRLGRVAEWFKAHAWKVCVR